MQPRTLSLATLIVAAALFVDFFLRWYGPNGHSLAGWELRLADTAGTLALTAALVEKARWLGAWLGRASELVAYFLAAAAGVMTLAVLIELRWSGFSVGGFSEFCYGAWIGLVLAIALVVLATLRLLALRPVAPQ